MKKLCPFVLLFSLQVSAQELSSKLSRAELNKEASTGKFDVRVKDGDAELAGFTNNIPPAVLRSFADRYEYVTGVSWFVDSRQATAAFKLDGQDHIVTYNRAGECICVRKSYTGNMLGLRINNLLQREIQKGYKVSYVTEVEHEQDTTYEVSLQNEKRWLMIKIHEDGRDGSLEEIDRNVFTKG